MTLYEKIKTSSLDDMAEILTRIVTAEALCAQFEDQSKDQLYAMADLLETFPEFQSSIESMKLCLAKEYPEENNES